MPYEQAAIRLAGEDGLEYCFALSGLFAGKPGSYNVCVHSRAQV
jgi:hypothetical protein